MTGITTHYYHYVKGEKPIDAPSVTPEVREVTRYIAVTDNGEIEVKPAEEGTHEAPMYVGDFQYNGKTVKEDGVTTHYYDRSVSEVPENAPISDFGALNATRFVTIGDNGVEREIAPAVEGIVPAPLFIGEREDYHYNGKTTLEESVTTHYYDVVEKGIPGDAPVAENPEKVFTEVPNEAPVHELPEKVLTEVPGDAPIHELPEKVLTEIPSEAPIHELPEKVLTEVPNEAPVHELTELVITEVPKDAPVLELEELKIPEEPKKDETPTPVPSVIKSEVPKKELPKTGQTETGTLQALGAILGLAALGLTMKSTKKED